MSHNNSPYLGSHEHIHEQHLAEVIEECREWQMVEREKGYEVSDNQCRKYCYRRMSNLLWGRLGVGHRRELPAVVVHAIRNEFPGTNGQGYMGFTLS